MRDIAEAMGCEVGNVYNYTKSKASLLEQHLFDMSKQFHMGIDKILEMDESAKFKLEKVISLHITLSEKNPLKASLLVNDWRNLKPVKMQDFLNERQDYENKLKSIIIQGKKEKLFAKLNPEITIRALLPSLRWVYNYFCLEDQKHSAKYLEKEMTTFLMRGLLIRD